MPEVITRSIIESINTPKIPSLHFSFDGLTKIKSFDAKIHELQEIMDRMWLKGMNFSPEKKYQNEKTLLEQAEVKYSPIMDDPLGALGSVWKIIRDFNPVELIKDNFPRSSSKKE
jgi:hypothetical protein